MTKEKSHVDADRGAKAPAASADAWTPLTSLRDEIDRLFDDFGTSPWQWPLGRHGSRAGNGAAGKAVAPAVEIVERDGEYRITAELPGMAPEDVDVKVAGDTITIRGEKSEERKEEKEDFLLSERRYGSFHRTLRLPPGVDADAINASCAHGVLTVTLPKSQEARRKERKIEVKTA